VNPDRALTGINASSQRPPPQALALASKGLFRTAKMSLFDDLVGAAKQCDW
jgi:hypothetical protein